jgi:2-keto-4-pentenoate hydratase
MSAAMQALGRLLGEAAAAGRSVAVDPTALPQTEEQAYAAQQAWLVAAGGRRAGWKVGATTAAGQAALGLAGPMAGPLLAERLHGNDATVRFDPAQGRLLEAELAFRLAADLPAEPSTGEIAAAVEGVAPAIELPAIRRTASPVAQPGLAIIVDGGGHGAVVLGAFVPFRSVPDLAAVAGRLMLDGRTVAEGTGAAVLGHPLNALAWLARRAAALGQPLRAGEVVITGAVCLFQPFEPGITAEAAFDGVGSVSARFDAQA